MIPKTLHFIWVGDEKRRPDNCIASWVRHNPDWTIKVWGNASLKETEWVNAEHMRKMYGRELNGVADMMRWEILYNEGGLVIDADSICLRPLDEELLDCDAFACWESEIARPGLIAAGYFGCSASNKFVGRIILDIKNEPSVINDMAWKTVGPQRLTDSYRRYQYQSLRILPSHFFIPEHFTGVVYEGPGPIYAHQLWGSTKRSYAELHLLDVNAEGKVVGSAMPAGTAAPTPISAATMLGARENATLSPLERLHEPRFVQRVHVSSDVVGLSRFHVFKKLCEGQRILHIGCAEASMTEPENSLYLALEPHCAKLDGFDVDADALAALAPHTKGRLYSHFEDLTDEYDLILVPEVMASFPDVGEFLAQLHTLKAPALVITVPDAYQCHARNFDYVKGTATFFEIVHPAHNCWYTPYTLSNVITKCTPWRIDDIWFFDNTSLLALISKPHSA